ncbi:MAG: DUF4194 domain-containing protein [Acidimicrobiales bacterium]
MTVSGVACTSPPGEPAAPTPSGLSVVVVNLLKGPIYRDTNERPWALLLGLRSQVADYVTVLGLQVIVDEAEGYAYLRSRPLTDATTDGDAPEVPRLVARRPLSFHVSLLVALLRKRLAEFDATSSDPRLVMTRDQIVEMLRLYMPESTNEARLVDMIDTQINKVVDLGFLRKLRGQDNLYEVRRIIKAYVDGQWLAELDARLDEYVAELGQQGDE